MIVAEVVQMVMARRDGKIGRIVRVGGLGSKRVRASVMHQCMVTIPIET